MNAPPDMYMLSLSKVLWSYIMLAPLVQIFSRLFTVCHFCQHTHLLVYNWSESLSLYVARPTYMEGFSQMLGHYAQIINCYFISTMYESFMKYVSR